MVSRAIAENPSLSFDVTNRGNTVAIVSNGTAVLGLGNIGPEAALPVMEGKAVILKDRAGVDGIPLCIASKSVEEVVAFCRAIAPSVGAIMIEDIRAPECFAIESSLQDLPIPVVHDDQHGTAIVVLAGLTNALKVVGKSLSEVRIVLNGCGAAGTAIGHLLRAAGCRHLTVCDSKGIISTKRPALELHKQPFAVERGGSLADALEGADVFVGVSVANVLTAAMVRRMSETPIVFAMANPDPELAPEQASKIDIAVYATGRSDLPNQVNNALVFPGLFLGMLRSRVSQLTVKVQRAVAASLAALQAKPTSTRILPDLFDRRVVSDVAEAVADSRER